ncbi:5'-nucleotidase domain-containing protein 1 [Frankliniella occidentalis]|uniref:5'-nucleotidase domain-containing protein 1 n=1 Tax=Frankliniella occidentalis TaxID=133901 RepID=A0A6J1TNG9_FRAOC|nr:5'-nucleotidase domain-containing protein 1 [Frankliniella occidentalis]
MLLRRLYSVAAVCASASTRRAAGPSSVVTTQFCCSYRTHGNATSEIMAPETSSIFRLSDYDCVGFDLDNTLLKYNIANMVKLEYEILAQFLVDQKGYDTTYLRKPLDLDFLQKGLTLDYENGNVLQLSPDGTIHRASHGTKLLTDAEIEDLYGKEKYSQLTQEYTQNMLDAWNGPISEKVRSVMDHFDVPASLAFARCVDNIDANAEKENIPSGKYNLYQDLTDALVHMFQRDNFANNSGGFFPTMKKNPELYMHHASENVRTWLKELRKQKKVFLVTGSHVDFASFTAKYSFGEDLKDLFDIVVTFARKPGFFTGRRPFVSLENGQEKDLVQPEDIHLGNIYSQGNWQDLYELFKKETGKKHPKCLYVGDNVLQDVFAPDEYTRCHTVAISEEMRGEGVGSDRTYHDVLASNTWGSYFSQKGKKPSLWCDLIQKHAAICVPSVDVLAEKPLDFQYQTFKCASPDQSQPVGFFPSAPK